MKDTKFIDRLFMITGDMIHKDVTKERNEPDFEKQTIIRLVNEDRRKAFVELLTSIVIDKDIENPEYHEDLLKDFCAYIIHYFNQQATHQNVGTPEEWINYYKAALQLGEFPWRKTVISN